MEWIIQINKYYSLFAGNIQRTNVSSLDAYDDANDMDVDGYVEYIGGFACIQTTDSHGHVVGILLLDITVFCLFYARVRNKSAE